MSKTLTVWITKYALTTGIFTKRVRDAGGGMTATVGDEYTSLYHARDWHPTEDLAIARAKEMRITKLKSLDKQIKKISALKFGGGK